MDPWDDLRRAAVAERLVFSTDNDSLQAVPIASTPYFLSLETVKTLSSQADLLTRFIAQAVLDKDVIDMAIARCYASDVGRVLRLIIHRKRAAFGPKYLDVLRNSTAILQRSDFYIVAGVPKLIEINTVAVSVLSMSARMAEIHRAHGHANVLRSTLETFYASLVELSRLKAHTPSIWLMLVPNHEPMAHDQLGLVSGYNEYCVQHGVPSQMHRCTCSDALRAIQIHGDLALYEDAKLGLTRIAGAYWRTGYTPEQCTSEYEELRMTLEMNTSIISIPTAEGQLVGMKTVQNAIPKLANTKQYRYLSNMLPSIARVIEDPDQITEWIDSTQNWDQMVLKSHAEGGGSCTFANSIPSTWQAILRNCPDLAPSYFLMERLIPDTQGPICFLYSNRAVEIDRAEAEIGLYAIFWLGRTDISPPTTIGFLTRMKAKGDTESGIARGSGVLSSLAIKGANKTIIGL